VLVTTIYLDKKGETVTFNLKPGWLCASYYFESRWDPEYDRYEPWEHIRNKLVVELADDLSISFIPREDGIKVKYSSVELRNRMPFELIVNNHFIDNGMLLNLLLRSEEGEAVLNIQAKEGKMLVVFASNGKYFFIH